MAAARRGPRRNSRTGPRIGLLGGSFNPAHEGHLHVSRLALKQLGLDRLWWLVSPQNPLKSTRGMAPFKERLRAARAVAAEDRRISVSDLEARLGTRYTADTLRMLKSRFPRNRFVWIMGADNLAQFARWRDWPAIFRSVPVAVFDRAPYSFRALASKAATRFAHARVPARAAMDLAALAPPAWTYLHTPLHSASASDIRARTNGKKAS